ncbi:MAG: hypothetical protein U1F61_05055 [Opitutaceae bacterium]
MPPPTVSPRAFGVPLMRAFSPFGGSSARRLLLFTSVIVVSAAVASSLRASETAPRSPRTFQALSQLYPYPDASISRPGPLNPVAAPGPASTPEGVVEMSRFVVTEDSLPAGLEGAMQRAHAATVAERFQPVSGGRILRSNRARLPTEVGVWDWEDVMKEDARFGPPRGRADFTLARLRW